VVTGSFEVPRRIRNPPVVSLATISAVHEISHKTFVFAVGIRGPFPHVEHTSKKRCALKQNDRITNGLFMLIRDEAERILTVGGLLDSDSLQRSGLEEQFVEQIFVDVFGEVPNPQCSVLVAHLVITTLKSVPSRKTL